MSRTLYLIRHGQTVDNHLKRYPSEDSPLSAQAPGALQPLRAFLPAAAPTFTSPSLRTRQTAEHLGLQALVSPALAEMDFGILAGHTWAELEALHGELPLQWLEHMQDPDSELGAPQGESGKAFFQRVQGFLQDLPEGPIVLVTHLGVIRALLRLTLNLQHFEVSPASLTVLSEHQGIWTLKHLNIAFPEKQQRSLFITGGARSGKSAFAEQQAMALGQQVTFIATGQAFDQEMQDRITRHQQDRPAHFETLEAPEDVLTALQQTTGVVLLDCLSLWVSNLMLQDLSEAEILSRARAVCQEIQQRKGSTVVVSNEVGLGIVPTNKLARQYRDVLGRVNQLFSAACDSSFFCVAGQALRVK